MILLYEHYILSAATQKKTRAAPWSECQRRVRRHPAMARYVGAPVESKEKHKKTIGKP